MPKKGWRDGLESRHGRVVDGGCGRRSGQRGWGGHGGRLHGGCPGVRGQWGSDGRTDTRPRKPFTTPDAPAGSTRRHRSISTYSMSVACAYRPARARWWRRCPAHLILWGCRCWRCWAARSGRARSYASNRAGSKAHVSILRWWRRRARGKARHCGSPLSLFTIDSPHSCNTTSTLPHLEAQGCPGATDPLPGHPCAPEAGQRPWMTTPASEVSSPPQYPG